MMTESTTAGEARTDGDEPPNQKLADLSKFQLRILAVLAADGGAPKGLAIKERLKEYYDAEVNHGQLYPNLDDLVNAGLVEKGTKDRRTNAYGISDTGRDALQTEVAWLVARTPSIEEGDM